MEELSNICRICLADDVGMRLIANTHLQEMYESLTLLPLQTKDGRPIQVCFICCGLLQNCYKLKNKCLQSEVLFTRVLSSGVLQPLPKEGCTRRLQVEHPVLGLSFGDVPQNPALLKHVRLVFHVDVEQHDEDVEDMKFEIDDVTIGENEPCSAYPYPVSVNDLCPKTAKVVLERMVLNDTTSVTDVEDTKLEIDDVTIEENEPYSAHPSSVSVNDLCSKTAKVVLERMVLNDATSVTDIAMEPQEEHDTQIDDDIQSSHLKDPLDVMKREPDDVGTYTDDIKLEIDDLTIEENEPYSAHPSYLSPVTGVPALQKLEKTDSVLSIEPENENKSVVRDKLTSVSGIHTTVDKVDDTLHTHVDIYKQTSESYIRSIKEGYSSKAKLELQTTHTGEKQFQCDECNKRFCFEAHLKRHMYTHTIEHALKPFKCYLCNKRFQWKKSLNRHLYTHAVEKPFKCDVCNESFETSGNLTQHMYKHKGKKTFKCDVCIKSFSRKERLKKHMYIHTGEKPFKCDVCNEFFTIKDNLTEHMYGHIGEKRFNCDVCNKSFLTKELLKRHMYIHTGEKPFECSMCYKWFRTEGSLTQHMVTHTGEKPFKCDVCNKFFTLKGNLKKHMYTHTGEKRFKCDVCNKCYTTKNNLNLHMVKHTGENGLSNFTQ